MPRKPTSFIYTFFVLFLCILLAMFVMFAVMVHYDRNVRAEEPASSSVDQMREASETRTLGIRDLTPLFRANLFAIDLCLIVLAEAALILLFVRFTIPATLIATVVILLTTANAVRRLHSELIPKYVSPFVTNRYATLTHTDLMLLIALSGLIMAFLVSILLKQEWAKPGTGAANATPPSPPSPDSSASG
jgi:hypothetical protein